MSDENKVGRRGYHGKRRHKLPVETRRLPPDDWPENDRLAWQRACSRGGPLDKGGSASHLKEASKKIRQSAYGRFLSFLTSVGELDPAAAPATRPTEQRITAYVESMRPVLLASVIHQLIVDLTMVLGAIEPARKWSWIRRLPCVPSAAEVRASKRPIVPPDPVEVLRGAYAACDAADLEATKLKAAMKFRDGVMVALLTCYVPRLKNLCETTIETNLVVHPTHIHLVYDRTVKNSETIDSKLSGRMETYMRRYLADYRPVLLRGREDHLSLWVNIDGNPLAYTTMYQLIRKVTASWGQKTGPQKMRHACATVIMNADPRQLQVASAALAHRGTSSVNQVYDRSGNLGAQSIWLKMQAEIISKPSDEDAEGDAEDE